MSAAATRTVICAPLRVEWLALRAAGAPVCRTGMGADRSAAARKDRAVLVAGVGGGLGRRVRVGDVVVATEVRGPAGERVGCASTASLVTALRGLGLTVHHGPIVSARRVVGGAARRALAETGALAVDTESVWLAPAGGLPFAVVRVITDTAARPLLRPSIVWHGATALTRLHRAIPALDAWVFDTPEKPCVTLSKEVS